MLTWLQSRRNIFHLRFTQNQPRYDYTLLSISATQSNLPTAPSLIAVPKVDLFASLVSQPPRAVLHCRQLASRCPSRISFLPCFQSPCSSCNRALPSILCTFPARQKLNYMRDSFKLVLIQCYKLFLADIDEIPQMSDGTLVTKINLVGLCADRRLCELKNSK